MPVVCDSTAEEAALGAVAGEYAVGERVAWRARVNNPHHYRPGEKVAGTVIAVFENGGRPAYRIELDIAWNATAPDMPLGRRIVVGNVRGGSLKTLGA